MNKEDLNGKQVAIATTVKIAHETAYAIENYYRGIDEKGGEKCDELIDNMIYPVAPDEMVEYGGKTMERLVDMFKALTALKSQIGKLEFKGVQDNYKSSGYLGALNFMLNAMPLLISEYLLPQNNDAISVETERDGSVITDYVVNIDRSIVNIYDLFKFMETAMCIMYNPLLEDRVKIKFINKLKESIISSLNNEVVTTQDGTIYNNVDILRVPIKDQGTWKGMETETPGYRNWKKENDADEEQDIDQKIRDLLNDL